MVLRHPASKLDKSPQAIRRWRSVTVHLPGPMLAELSQLARALGVSRVSLIREALESVGLPYARALARGRGVSTAPAPPAPQTQPE